MPEISIRVKVECGIPECTNSCPGCDGTLDLSVPIGSLSNRQWCQFVNGVLLLTWDEYQIIKARRNGKREG